MSPPVRVRQTDDLDLIKAMDGRILGAPLGSVLEDSTWWVAETRLEGSWAPVGYAGAQMTNEDRYVFLSRAGVEPMARGAGLQLRLIRARLRWAQSSQCTHAWTYTSVANVRSMRSLIRCGLLPYQEDGLFLYFKKKLTR